MTEFCEGDVNKIPLRGNVPPFSDVAVMSCVDYFSVLADGEEQGCNVVRTVCS